MENNDEPLEVGDWVEVIDFRESFGRKVGECFQIIDMELLPGENGATRIFDDRGLATHSYQVSKETFLTIVHKILKEHGTQEGS